MNGTSRRPLLYEINTRCWLKDLSVSLGRAVTLADVPETEFERWQRLGFTHVWLMGAWTSGPLSRAAYLQHADTAARLNAILPGWRDADVAGSPYAISEYQVPAALGGERGMETFRAQLHRHDLRLVLDFVPNHVGLDHPWVIERPELFVQSERPVPDTFWQNTKAGSRWLAHGKDPYFPAWNDTAQLDLRRADTCEAVIDEFRPVAERCDGVRCDMAMLLLNDVFAKHWQSFPIIGPPARGEFWSEANRAVKRPGFLLTAEAYWDLETRLQELGFDFTYDKRVTDLLLHRRPLELSQYLRSKGAGFLQRSVHFLENHDEPRVASQLSLAEHRAAALLILGLPGLPLLHEGQLTGARVRVPVHLTRRLSEPVDVPVADLYQQLLTTLVGTRVGRGSAILLQPLPPRDHAAAPAIVVVCWPGDRIEDGADLVVVNLTGDPASARVVLPAEAWAGGRGEMFDWLSDRALRPVSAEWRQTGGPLFLPPHGAQLWHFQPVALVY